MSFALGPSSRRPLERTSSKEAQLRKLEHQTLKQETNALAIE
jgi:hypothetical protein